MFVDFLKKLNAITAVVQDDTLLQACRNEQRGAYNSKPLAVVMPTTTAEIAAIVKLCQQYNIAIVPQGGNTGLVGGSVALEQTPSIIISTTHLNKIRHFDTTGFAIIAEAGCTLNTVKKTAATQNLFFPLGLSVADTCQIGGTIASNAGGLNVLRYGSMRALVLGLEAVLPNGEIWQDLSSVRKKNHGIDLKQLFIGSEGCLGIITAACLQLFPAPNQQQTIFIECDSAEAALTVYQQARHHTADLLDACELISLPAWQLVAKHRPHLPCPTTKPYSVLLSLAASGNTFSLQETAQKFAAQCKTKHLQAHLIEEASAALLWQRRKEIPWVQREEGASIKHDIALPASAIPAFLQEAQQRIQQECQAAQFICFGHLGDGNLHYNISQPAAANAADFLQYRPVINSIVYTLIKQYDGSISAEHGIGLAKQQALRNILSESDLHLRLSLKKALDPQMLLNPHKGVWS